MRPFKDQPISRKTLALGVLPALFALLIGILASLVSTSIASRRNQMGIVGEQATFIATAAAAGVAAGDKRIANELVHAFQVRTNIDALCVYDAAGSLFSFFQRQGRVCPATWPSPIPALLPTATRPVMSGGQAIG